MGSTLLIPALVLLVTFISGTKGNRKCWACTTNSSIDSNCGDPFQIRNKDGFDKVKLSCGSNNHEQSAVKFVCIKHKELVNGTLVISRGCMRADDTSNLCTNEGAKNSIFCETCDEDGCNGATGVSAAMTILLGPLALNILFK